MKTNLAPLEYVRVLTATQAPCFLLSAYDVETMSLAEREECLARIAAVQQQSSIVLMDSGNYERYWKDDYSWTQERYASVLGSSKVGLAFTFDDQNPDPDPNLSASMIVDHHVRDQGIRRDTLVCPIVHARGDALLDTVGLVARALQPIALAVAERELGDGILARARMLRHIRARLDEVAPHTCIHVLGTGNPLALLIYAISGADSFDGLEWCQTCVDPDTALLHHFQHRDLVRTLPAAADCQLSYVATTLFHNLLFFRGWMESIRTALVVGDAVEMLRKYLPTGRATEISLELAK